ncbi:hypothetical protein EYZ11_008005 [Aspergillus tanneri]|nr:hypothetical protein EYZ11_008005 [Aspergillus tanneri]
MPLEQALKSPVRSSTGEAQNPWADDQLGSQWQSGLEHNTAGQPPVTGNDSKEGGAVSGGRELASSEWQLNSGLNDASEWERSRNSPIPLRSNNPFLKVRQPENNPWEDRNSRTVSEDTASLSQDDASARLGKDEGYIPMTARLSLFDQPVSESPWIEEQSNNLEPPSTVHQSQHPSPQSYQYPDNEHDDRNVSPIPFPESQAVVHSNQPAYTPQPSQQQHDSGKLSPDNEIATPATISTATSGSSHVLIDFNESLQPNTGTDQNKAASPIYEPTVNGRQESQESQVSSQIALESAPPLPDRANVSRSDHGVTSEETPVISTSEAEGNRQQEKKLETYSIRHVNWTDVTGKLRDSPVLSQNKNGPCPLLALVNALVLRANPDTQSPIVRALQTREQISLGLLIEALFDELTTCLGPDDELPDIEALSRFLTMLHTGMNVNPRLILESNDAVGTFRQTDDIRLYSTFGVPLVHGWVAALSTDVHMALMRIAQYHEDVQLLHFRKEELEDRIFHGGSLEAEEEQEMKDIQLIQHFTDVENATQLSMFGLDCLTEKLPPGSLSILFRNDHFSTLYKHPQSKKLFALVTDAGYSGHAEIVWESLVDVNGSSAGFFAGDFRPVGHTSSPGASDPSGPRMSSNTRTPSAPSEQHSSTLSAQEQADADYAYALSLQYQEEEQRESTGDSRMQNPLRATDPRHSRQGSSGFTNGSISPHTSYSGNRSSRQSQHVRQAQHQSNSQMANDGQDDAPPPSYEQAASSPIYPSPRRSPNPMNNTSYAGQYPGSRGGRRPPGTSIPGGPPERTKDRNKECVVM